MVRTKNDTTKLKDTEIPISVRTGLMHSNKIDEAQTRITFTGFYIQAMNYFVRLVLAARKDLANELNSITRTNDAEFFENLQFITQISEAFAEWLPDYADGLNDKTETLETSAIAETPGDIAVQISDLLRNPDLPVEIYNAILHGTDEIVNTSSSDANGKYETSPEHIKAILKMCSNE